MKSLFAAIYLTAALSLISQACAQDAASMAAGSSWRNELGSVMTISSFGPAPGQFSGTYVSAVGCDAGTTFPLSGWINGNAISFSVDWGSNCNSVTAWAGQYVASTDSIKTLWYLATNTVGWSGLLAGSNQFSRVN